jgi:hypothetical protein
MKYSIFFASLAGTALAIPMSNILNERQVESATQGATDAVSGLTGAATQGATDAAGGLTGAAPEGATDAAAGPTDSLPSGGQQAPQQSGQQAPKPSGPLGAGLLGGTLIPGLLRASAPLSPEDIAMLQKNGAQMQKRQLGPLSIPGNVRTSAPLSPEDIAMLKNGAQMEKRQLDTVIGLVTGLLPGILRASAPLSPEDTAMLKNGAQMEKRQLDAATAGESLSEEDIAKIISGGTVKRDYPLLTREEAAEVIANGGIIKHKRDEPLSPEDIAMINRNGQ